jgi:hypothetical protein
MAKFDKKQFASALAEAICSNSMKCDNIASTDMHPSYNEETDTFTLTMAGYEDEWPSLARAHAGQKFIPQVFFKLTFKIDVQQDPNYDPADWE